MVYNLFCCAYADLRFPTDSTNICWVCWVACDLVFLTYFNQSRVTIIVPPKLQALCKFYYSFTLQKQLTTFIGMAMRATDAAYLHSLGLRVFQRLYKFHVIQHVALRSGQFTKKSVFQILQQSLVVTVRMSYLL